MIPRKSGDSLTPSLIWKILLYGWPLSELLLAVTTHTRKSGGSQRDRGSLFVLWGTISGSMTAAGFMPFLEPKAAFVVPHWLSYAAMALMIAGLMVRWIAIVSLGKAFSVNVAIRNAQTLYRSGLYRIVRHPSYSGMLICFSAIAIVEQNWISSAVVLLLPTAALLYRIHVEEKALNEAFGVQYAEYSKATMRLIPGIY
jgi:protein-S-isoprenylcysteine O-methyltransferase Ste14